MFLPSSKLSDNGLLKSIRESIPVKLTGALASAQDSMRMLGEEGAENLIGNGDMILKDIKTKEKIRVQTPFVSTEEQEILGNKAKD